MWIFSRPVYDAIGNVGVFLGGAAAAGGWVTSLMNRRTLKDVHAQTNSIAQRNESMAFDAGRTAERETPSDHAPPSAIQPIGDKHE
jgi:hypothetical protein